jgi:gluconate 2-dehydrogenase gamma chain
LGYQLRYTPRELYRSGIAAANNACRTAVGKAFADLPLDEQDRFLASLEKNQVQLSGPPA